MLGVETPARQLLASVVCSCRNMQSCRQRRQGCRINTPAKRSFYIPNVLLERVQSVIVVAVSLMTVAKNYTAEDGLRGTLEVM